MLRSLHIENYVLIDYLDVEFPDGLIIITGRTGAGKSILLGALSLLTGAKADASLISDGADSLIVEAEFQLKDNLAISRLLEDAGIEYEDENLLIRRVVHRSGRSRAFVNDCPCSTGVLGELASYLIDIHSQHQNLLLSKSSFQLNLLDHFADSSALRGECGMAWNKVCALDMELSALKDRIKENSDGAEYKRAQWEQLENAKLREGEFEELEAEQKELSHAEEIKALLGEAAEGCDLSAQLKGAQKALEKVEKYWEGAGELASRIESSRIELEDICYEVQNRGDGLQFSQERLEQVDDRIALLHQLMRKHSKSSVEELIELRDSLKGSLAGSEDLQERLSELDEQFQKAQAEYGRIAAELHERRSKAAGELALELQNSIRELELEKAVFEVELGTAKPSGSGVDECCFKFDSNGRKPSDLSKCASGGELSRIMLCIKEMMSRYIGMPTMIFDEIDTGVSGSAAHKMGQLITKMGAHMQVFAITHLPQVAAKGQAHYVVMKEEVEGRSVSTLIRLTQQGRIEEIARLLSSEQISAEALANAKNLLENNE